MPQFTLWMFSVAAAIGIAASPVSGQEPLAAPPQPLPIAGGGSSGDKAPCPDCGGYHQATASHGAWLGGRLAARGVCPDCGQRHGGTGGGPVRNACGSVSAMVHSGQPLVDPWMRGDWIAQQRAAQMSWHAGYYHSQWGGPVALMVAPTVRAHTRWGWGVAQTTVEPLYQQFDRPYPGPVAGVEAGMGGNPLLPTPRWPSHTDQFGVYYVRGPW